MGTLRVLRSSIGLGILAVAPLLSMACDGGGPAGPELVVNSNADVVERDGVLTLREAILLATGGLSRSELDSQEAAQVPGDPGSASGDVIAFAMSFQGEEAIGIASMLPSLADGGDTIDASAVGGVVIDGGDRSFVCIEITSSGNALLGLQIVNCHTGIMVRQAVEENRIGGSGASEGNVISGNVVGIELRGRKNVIQGNLIGVDASGATAMGNEFEGIWITPVGRENSIGGSKPGEGNVISGNELFGVSIDGAVGNVLQGNLIGLDSSGSQAVGNRYGITIQAGATGNVVGGEALEERNVISANNTGLLFRDPGTSGNLVQGNYFGTDTSGEAEVANVVDVWARDDAGENALEGNLLSRER